MDHPVYELQPALSVEETLRVLDLVCPKVTTIPDVHENAATTWHQFEQYAPVMRQAFPHIKLMGVPQGLDVDSILESAYNMADSGLCDMLAIGIKRSLPDLDRALIVRKVLERYPEMRFHLLGARWPYTNEVSMADWEPVESMDTAEPVNAAMRGVPIFKVTEQSQVARDPLFQSMSRRALMQSRLVCKNIESFQAGIATQTALSVEEILKLP